MSVENPTNFNLVRCPVLQPRDTAYFLRPQYDQDFFYLCFKVHVHLPQTGVAVVGDGANVTYHQPSQSFTAS